MEGNLQELIRYKQFAEWIIDELSSYKRNIGLDIDLTSAAKPKMESLIVEFLTRISAFLQPLKNLIPKFERIEKGVAVLSPTLGEEHNVLRKEFQCMKKQFEKLTITTPRLVELKRIIDQRLQNYDNQYANKVAISKPSKEPMKTRQSDVNEKWWDNLITDVKQKNEGMTKVKKEKSKISTKPATRREKTTYVSGLKIIQDEFSEIKKSLETLLEERKSARFVDSELERISSGIRKVESYSELVQKEFAEMQNSIHALTKRVDLMEKDNQSLRLQLQERGPDLPSPLLEKSTISLLPNIFAEKTPQPEASKILIEKYTSGKEEILSGISDWVLKRIKKSPYQIFLRNNIFSII